MQFNSDLLLNPADETQAKQAFGGVFFALNDDALKAFFKPHDKRANDAKARSQGWGLSAVVLVTMALIAASAEPLYHGLGEPWLKVIAALSALFGVAGALIGIAGVRYGEKKESWLVERLITERVRQFHFQALIVCAEEIVGAVGNPAAEQRFLSKRAKLVESFVRDLEQHAGAKLTAIVEGRAEHETWLVESPSIPDAFAGAHADDLLRALELLRIRHQLDYANHKLSADHKLFSSKPGRQAAVLSGAALFCMAGLVLLHVLMLFDVLLDAPGAIAPHPHVYVIVIAIIALAIRTIEEGLQPQTEVERYRHYAATLRQLRDRFNAAQGAEKLAVLRDLEVTSYDEMVTFLKSNHEVRFIV